MDELIFSPGTKTSLLLRNGSSTRALVCSVHTKG